MSPPVTALLDASPLDLETVLTTGPRLQIPDYQRPFTWKKRDWQPLWEDISELAIRNLLSSGTQESHFIGNVVLAHDPPYDTEVIDGQQRLTYLTILLVALLEVADAVDKAKGGTTAWRVQLERCLFEVTLGQKRLRLQAADPAILKDTKELVLLRNSKADREIYLLTMPGTERTPRGRLRRALEDSYESVAAYLAGYPKDQTSAGETLLRTVTGSLLAIQVDVKDPSQRFDVFERLNARGVPLNKGDLIKNLILNHAERARQRTKVRTELTALQTAISDAGNWISVADAYHLIYCSTWGWTRFSDVLTGYRKVLETSSITPADLATYLREQGTFLAQLLDPPASWGADKQRGCLLLTTYLRNKFALTLPLAAISAYGAHSKEFTWSLRVTNSYVFRAFIVGDKQLSAYTQEISNWAALLGVSAPTKAGLWPSILASVPVRKRPNAVKTIATAMRRDNKATAFTSRFRAYVPRSRNMGFYVAYMLESGEAARVSKQAFPGTHPDLRSPSQHLEHIMPQNAPSASAWAVSPALSDILVPRWGNLLVLPGGVNSSIQDKGFAEKQRVYGSPACAALLLPKAVKIPGSSASGSWDELAISARERKLAGRTALMAWPFPEHV